jgi:MFS transporter, ACS family, hexuronate transporter
VNIKGRILAAVWFRYIANYLDRVAMSFAGPSIMKSLHMAPNTFGVVLSSFGVGYLLAQIPGGLLADRWGAKPLLVIGPIFWALFTGATGLVATVAGFVIVRVCFGLSEGISNSSVFKAIGDNFNSQQRARAMSTCVTALALAPAFAGPLVGALLSVHGWRGVFVMMMAPALIAALVNYLLIPGSRLAPDIVRGAPLVDGEGAFTDVLRRPSLWLISISQFAFNIAYWGYLSWMPSYLAFGHHIDLKAIGPLGGIPYIFAFFGLLFSGWLGSTILHRHRPQMLACFHVLAGLSLFFAYRAGTLPLSLAGLSSAAFFLYGNLGPAAAIMLDLSPERSRAAYAGIVATAGQLGATVSPAIVGFLVGATGTFASGFGFMIAGLCVAAGCMIAVVPLLSGRPLQAVATT